MRIIIFTIFIISGIFIPLYKSNFLSCIISLQLGEVQHFFYCSTICYRPPLSDLSENIFILP